MLTHVNITDTLSDSVANLLVLVDFHLLLSHLPASSLVESLNTLEIPDSQLQ